MGLTQKCKTEQTVWIIHSIWGSRGLQAQSDSWVSHMHLKLKVFARPLLWLVVLMIIHGKIKLTRIIVSAHHLEACLILEYWKSRLLVASWAPSRCHTMPLLRACCVVITVSWVFEWVVIIYVYFSTRLKSCSITITSFHNKYIEYGTLLENDCATKVYCFHFISDASGVLSPASTCTICSISTPHF